MRPACLPVAPVRQTARAEFESTISSVTGKRDDHYSNEPKIEAARFELALTASETVVLPFDYASI